MSTETRPQTRPGTGTSTGTGTGSASGQPGIVPGLWRRQVQALITKEFAQIVRDPSSYMIALLLPALFLFLFGYGISLDQNLLRVGILDESRTQSSRALVADFAASPWFQVELFRDLSEAEDAMRSTRIQGFVRIREDYERQLAALSASVAASMKTGTKASTKAPASASENASTNASGDAFANTSPNTSVNTSVSRTASGAAGSEITADHAAAAGLQAAGTQAMSVLTRARLAEQTKSADTEAETTLQLIVDGTEPNTASFLQGYAQKVITLHSTGLLRERNLSFPSVNMEERYWYNASARSVNFLVPGSVTVIMTLIGTLLTSLVFAREWERGTMEAMLATPVTRDQLILGKLIPYFCLGMFSLLLCTVLAILVFAVPFRGSYLVLLLVSSIFMLCALGQGLLISVHLKGQLVAAEAGLFSGFLPSLLLSGFIFDVGSMPPILQALAQLLPATHFNLCLRSLFLAGTLPSVLIPHTLCLLGLAALLMYFVRKGLRKSIE